MKALIQIILILFFCNLLNAESSSSDLIIGEYGLLLDEIKIPYKEFYLKKMGKEPPEKNYEALKKLLAIHNYSMKVTKDTIVKESKTKKIHFTYEVAKADQDQVILKTKLTKYEAYDRNGKLIGDSKGNKMNQVSNIIFKITEKDGKKVIKFHYMQRGFPYAWKKK